MFISSYITALLVASTTVLATPAHPQKRNAKITDILQVRTHIAEVPGQPTPGGLQPTPGGLQPTPGGLQPTPVAQPISPPLAPGAPPAAAPLAPAPAQPAQPVASGGLAIPPIVQGGSPLPA